MNKPAQAQVGVPGDGMLAHVQKAVTTGQLIGALIGMIIGIVVAALAVYNHFAKASELGELACKVVEQNAINNEMITTSREIQAALKLLKRNFEAAPEKAISASFMASEIANAVGKIEQSLSKVDEVRQASQKKAIMKDGKC